MFVLYCPEKPSAVNKKHQTNRFYFRKIISIKVAIFILLFAKLQVSYIYFGG